MVTQEKGVNMDLKVTPELALKAVLMGACRMPEIGKKVEDFSFSDLVWGEKLFQSQELKIPLWACAKSGYGSGYGSGDGSGSGSGYDSGYGYGLIEKTITKIKEA